MHSVRFGQMFKVVFPQYQAPAQQEEKAASLAQSFTVPSTHFRYDDTVYISAGTEDTELLAIQKTLNALARLRTITLPASLEESNPKLYDRLNGATPLRLNA